ncbi:MAG: OmpA family protein [Paludibacteraceae bacterium]|jgi:outer membrane protein OmpA-like peptidoglycan-associated protein|nr:OmpA family protein [Paludibacteraceae bacterium]
MSKKFLALAAAATLAGNAFAQEQATADTATAKGICHWSLGLKGGVNYLRWAPVAEPDRTLSGTINGQFGIFTEATFNPRWGLGLQYMYAMNNQETYDAVNHDIILHSSFNLSNIVAPYRSMGLQKLNVYVNPGVVGTIGVWENSSKVADDNKFVMGLYGAGQIEYNVSKYFAIGLEGTAMYRLRTCYPEGGHLTFGANLEVRYKFGGDRNIRNIAWVDYAPKCEVPDLTPVLEEQKRQCEELTSKLEEQIVNQNVAINKLQQQIKFTQDSLDSHIRATREPVRYVPTKEEDEIIKTAFAQLEFESAKAIIKQSSYSSLDGLAMLLKSHPEWSVTLKGYTDNSGNAAKNLQLSKDRAASVKNYLVNKGVSAANIQSQGYGSANPVASNSTLAGRAKNRRVEIELFSK